MCATKNLHQHKQLSNIRLEHIEWGIEESLSRLGLSKTDSKKILPSLYHFWKKRFFDDAYLRFDFPLLGSPSFTQECFDREMTIVYLTGRSHLQRSGTETALRRFDFPYDNQRTHLITKRDPYQKDVLHKSQAIEEICTLGTPKLFLDNEPRNVNRFKELFPAEMIVFVDTVHSPNSPPIKEGIHSIYSFMYTT